MTPLGMGPFESHVFPGVYTRTVRERGGGPPAGIRPLVIIGVGQEYLEVTDLELVRGSSATVDQRIVNEDVSERFVLDETNPDNPVLGAADGVHSKFKVRNLPIVTGEGRGETSTSPTHVEVTVDGTLVAVAQVNGTKGEVTLQSIPAEGSTVLCTYYYNRTDTQVTEDVSDQVSEEYALLYSSPETFEVTEGINDTFKLSVNGGSEKTVTLTAGAGRTALQIIADINAAQVTGLTVSVDLDEQGQNRIELKAASEIEIGNGNANALLGFAAGQTSGRNKSFRTFQRPIVDGSNGGITSTDPTDVTVAVNGTDQTPVSIDGTNGWVTLSVPPPVGATVAVTYYFNTYQDTFDYLPNDDITEVGNCGYAPGRRDYLNLSDFVVSDGKIYWGTSVSVTGGDRSAGAEPFDDTQISTLLIDNRIYMAECERYVDTSVTPSVVSDNEFVLPMPPTTGNGRNSPLGSSLYETVSEGRIDLPTNRPDLVIAYRGRDVVDALNNGPIDVLEVDSSTRRVKLGGTVPPGDLVFCTFWYNRITDDTFTLECLNEGVSGTGKYSVLSSLTGTNQYAVLFAGKSGGLAETVQWPSGVETVPDAIHVGGDPVLEIVTVTFHDSTGTPAIFTNTEPGPYSCYDGASDLFYYNVDNIGMTNVDLSNSGAASIVSGACGTTIDCSGGNNLVEFTVDGVSVPVTLGTSATEAIADIVTAINLASNGTALSADIAETIGTGALTRLRIFSPTAPTGPDDVSTVVVESGTANTPLLLTEGDESTGIEGAVALPATLLSSNAESYAITAGVNDIFRLTIDGVPYEVSLTAGTRTAAQIATDINTETGASNAGSVTVGASNYLRLYSNISSPDSKIIIGDGTANTTLGFTSNQTGDQRLPGAEEISVVLNDDTTFKTRARASTVTQAGVGVFLRIESLTIGTTSSIAFGTGTDSAFNDTGLGIVPGTSGDVGEGAGSYFDVTSSHSEGSGTGTSNIGYPGQTYTDEVTGLRFTVLESTTGSYTDGESFGMSVVDEIPTNANTPVRTIPGVEMTVANTVNVSVGDTSIVRTFDKSGNEPSIGDFYYISYSYTKDSWDTELFTSDEMPVIKSLYGEVSVENRLSLAADIAFKNGIPYLGLKQVPKVEDSSQASVSSFIEAIKELEQPLPGDVKPYVIVPLTTEAEVISYLEQHCAIQSSPRYGNRRIGFFGFASGTKPTDAQATAKAIGSHRMRTVYPDSAIVGIENEIGEETEQIVDGTYLAVALAASCLNPINDFAQPYTNRTLQGFKRLGRQINTVEQSQTAISGINVLQDTATAIEVMQGFTTDMSDLLTQIPTITQIDDQMHVNMTKRLKKFTGVKFLPSLPAEVQSEANGVLRAMKEANLIADYEPAVATAHPDDPTLILVEAYYAPIFPNLYILVTQHVRIRI